MCAFSLSLSLFGDGVNSQVQLLDQVHVPSCVVKDMFVNGWNLARTERFNNVYHLNQRIHQENQYVRRFATSV